MRVRNQFWSVLFAFVVALLSVTPVFADPTATSLNDAVYYRLTFTSSWSQDTHPHPDGAERFPTNAHFSPLIGATHDVTTTFWADGELASAGMEQMAETGRVLLLREEFAAAGDAVFDTLNGAGIPSPGETTIAALRVDRDHPRVTLVTMVAPSPDWFVGVSSLSLLDEKGEWRNELEVVLYPYDAGSDDGADYHSTDIEPALHQPIADVTGVAPFSNQPMGVFTFQRIHLQHLPIIASGDD
jgi:hypothetical protein